VITCWKHFKVWWFVAIGIWFFPGTTIDTIDTKLVPQVYRMIAGGFYEHLENIFLFGSHESRVNYTLKNQPQERKGRNEPQAISLGDKISLCKFLYVPSFYPRNFDLLTCRSVYEDCQQGHYTQTLHGCCTTRCLCRIILRYWPPSISFLLFTCTCSW